LRAKGTVVNDATQKVVNRKIVNKTPAEIEKDNPSPPTSRMAMITIEQWQDVLRRLDKLEISSIKSGE
jgi:hypothetical protein